MALPAPECTDKIDLQFKLQSKIDLFKSDQFPPDNCNLLATASNYGLIFAGCITPALKVIQLKDLISEEKHFNQATPVRTVNLPSEPFHIAISCDHNYLAVDVIQNGIPTIIIYYVPSFLSANVQKIKEIRISSNDTARCRQILWNPVIGNMFSVCTTDGSLSVYTLKDQNSMEFYSVDKSEGVLCACWSPKGKQIVAGFMNGKLVQYKPDLKPAKQIPCPPNIMEGGNFDIIALQWLSTYQFAAIFLSKADDSIPALHIINAPKAGIPSYINYDDICYSQSVPRDGQVFLQYILPWNLLLMASANSMEVGILGTTETGETPTWQQWVTLDEARAELPLVDKQESYPVGMVLETGCTHQLTINEVTFPVMPMLHLYSTHGSLVSFTILNTTANNVGICSPPKPVSDLSGLPQFKLVSFEPKPTLPAPPPQYPVVNAPPAHPDTSVFLPTGATSTPAVMQKSKSFFSPSADAKSSTNLTGSFQTVDQNQTVVPTFGKAITFGATAADSSTPFGGQHQNFAGFTMPNVTPTAAVTKSTPLLPNPTLQPVPVTTNSNQTKPFITVPPSYSAPPPSVQPVAQKSDSSTDLATKKSTAAAALEQNDENGKIILSMIADEIRKFDKEINDLLKRSKSIQINIGTKEESTIMIKNLKELQDLSVQATESTESLTSDVQTCRLAINESFAMLAEANSKNSLVKNPTPQQVQESHAMSQSCRRQLAKLQNMLTTNEAQLQIINKQLDSQWSSYQDSLRKNSKNRMHIPSLEVLYQTLSKQQEILTKHKEQLFMLKSRLGIKENSVKSSKSQRSTLELLSKTGFGNDNGIESLTDSIVSLSLVDQVQADTKRLTDLKLNQIRDSLKNHKIVIVKPKRPDRPGLSSEVVRQKLTQARKLNFDNVVKEKSKTTTLPTIAQPNKLYEEKQKAVTQQPVSFTSTLPAVVTKPSQTISKPTTTTSGFGFPSAQTNLFAAPTVTPAAAIQKPSVLSFGVPSTSSSSTTFSFGDNLTNKPLSFGSVAPVQKTNKEDVASPLSVKNLVAPQPTKADKENQKPEKKDSTVQSTKSSQPPQEANKNVGQQKGGITSTSTNVPISVTSTTSSSFEVSNSVTISKVENPIPKPSLSFGTSTNMNISGYDTSKPAFSFGQGFSSVLQPDADKNKVLPPPGNDTNNKENASIFTIAAVSGAGNKPALPGLTSLLTAKKDGETESLLFGNASPFVAPTANVSDSATFKIPAATTVTTTQKPTETVVSTETTTTTNNLFSLPNSSSSTTIANQPATTITSTSTFGFAPSTQPTSGFTFGSATTTASDTSLFAASAPVASTTSLFASSTSTVTTTTPTPAIVTQTVATTPASSFSFASTFGNTQSEQAKPTPTIPSTTASTSASAFGTFSFATALPSTATTTTSTVTTTSTAADTASNIFQSFNICSPTATDSVSPTTPTKSSGNIFGGFGGSFSKPNETAQTTIFGTPTATDTPTKPDTGMFGKVSESSTSLFATPTGQTSAFGGTSIFGGGQQQQQQSAFGSTSLFASPKPAETPAFGGSPSVFGGANTVQSPSSGGGSFFGSTTAFGSSQTTGSIFGGSPTAQANTGGTNIFGGGGFGGQQQQQQTSSIFGGGGGQATFGGFGQTADNSSISQTGFGSPSTAFNKPTAFGSPAPAFGATPTFGGGATFGNPPSFGGAKTSAFGSFNVQTPANPLSSPSQSNSLFEQLGTSNTGMTFGNLAQQQQPKSAEFGGSSFTSWR
uniref:Nuclear pore complex protein Nup214 n=1 Tax=Corethrella appendiculata TaxID=1370023 RepID=W4VRS6_9DIPT